MLPVDPTLSLEEMEQCVDAFSRVMNETTKWHGIRGLSRIASLLTVVERSLQYGVHFRSAPPYGRMLPPAIILRRVSRRARALLSGLSWACRYSHAVASLPSPTLLDRTRARV